MKLLRTIILAVIFLTMTQFVYSQSELPPKSDSIVRVGDMEYYIHTVAKGETAYSLSKSYGITLEVLYENNPDAVYGLRFGETLRIPVISEKTTVTPPVADEPEKRYVYDFIEYRTTKKEPLVDIANRFQVSLQELKQRNPRLGNNVAKNEVVFIPIQKKATEVLLEPKKTSVQQPEMTVSSSSDVFWDLLKSKDSLCVNGWDTKKKYTVALILPFSAERLATTLSSSTAKKNVRQNLESMSVKYLSFYHGVALALDSLAAQGLNIRLNVYDINRDWREVDRLLEKPEMRTTDLIIGIIYADAFKKIADFSKQYHIPLINVASSRNDILQDYPNVAKIVPDESVISHAAQRIVSEDDNVNILIIRRNATAYSRSVEKITTLYPHYKEFLSDGKSMSSAVPLLDSRKPNFVFMFNENTTEVLDLMRVFDEIRRQYDVTLVGYPNWNNIGELDYRYAHNLKLHFIVPQVVDYNEQRVKDFVYMFRNRFDNDPNLLAFQGYDIAYNFIFAMGMFGQNCLECFNYIPHHFLSTGDVIFNNTPGNGYNNQYWNIYTVQEYEIVRIP